MFEPNYPIDVQDEDFFQNVVYEDSGLDTKWKGIQLAESSAEFALHDFRVDEPDFFKAGSDAFICNISPKLVVEVDASTGLSIELPETPIGVTARHFEINYSSWPNLQADIQAYLNNVAEFDFSFVQEEHMWKGKHLQGSCWVEVEVRLFHNPRTKSFTISVAKTEGEALGGPSFHDLFADMRAKFDPSHRSSDSESTNSSNNCRNKRMRRAPPLPANLTLAIQPTEEQFISGIMPIFNMAKQACMESRLEAVRMLCDCATKATHYLELPQFRTGCIDTLSALVTDEFCQIRQHAIMAVAAFAEIQSYQNAMVTSRLLPVIFSLVENSPEHSVACDTAQIRRSAAAVLTLLCRSHPYQVRTQLQQHHLCDVEEWIQFTVPSLLCPGLKAQAKVAAELLSEVVLTPADTAAWHDELGSDVLTSLIH